MSDSRMPKDKVVIQLVLLIVLCIVFLASFRLIDKIYETKYKMKIAELGYEYNKEIK